MLELVANELPETGITRTYTSSGRKNDSKGRKEVLSFLFLTCVSRSLHATISARGKSRNLIQLVVSQKKKKPPILCLFRLSVS